MVRTFCRARGSESNTNWLEKLGEIPCVSSLSVPINDELEVCPGAIRTMLCSWPGITEITYETLAAKDVANQWYLDMGMYSSTVDKESS
jgi:hypothetical protein